MYTAVFYLIEVRTKEVCMDKNIQSLLFFNYTIISLDVQLNAKKVNIILNFVDASQYRKYILIKYTYIYLLKV